ncbi:T9SS type A sorting domain-containing protein [uncultured Psychroserpens sp.]|uniref:T9SS type A sorting domain-containing protein n=1 Tax=uncultured Psychroserpens sp. TaxID=255436 RepID=UPI0026202FC0|nr:T9SS type A sorting domain-containing protein [uncultured Psychroserpens sp.]
MASLSYAQTTDLLFSKYGEGSGDNKFLEIYNGTGSDVDLSNYSLSSCSNGCNTFDEFDFPDNVTFAPGTILADGDVYVIAHPSADATILAVADQTFTFLSNGDDAFALTLAGATADTYTIIDILGDLQDDPGSGWAVGDDTNGTQNQTLTRKTSVCSPNPVPLASFGMDAATSEWVIGDSNSGWDTLGSYTGCSTTPAVTITSPGDGSSVASGTTSVDVVFNAENAPGGSTFDITVVTNGGTPVTTNGVTSPFTITPTADGDTFMVTVELIDGGGPIASDMSSFDIAFPCDLQVGTITETCDSITPATDDTYNVTIAYTGGATTTYTVDTGGVGTVGGDDPTSVADGTITITGITEGTDFTVTFTGDPANSSCDFTRNINSPDCDPALTLPLYEGFDYAQGSELRNTPNWANISDSSDEILIGGPGGLTYPQLASSSQTGNHVTFDGAGSDTAIEFTAVDSGNTLYASFLINVTDNSAATTPGYFAILGGFDARLWIVPIAPPSEQGTGGQYQIGISNVNTAPSGASLDPTVLNAGSTVLVVMSYNTTDGVINTWVNPSDATFGGTAPAATATVTDASPETSLDQFALRQDSTGETPFILFDELRLGTSWAEVTPTTLSTEDFTADNFKVYPNPTSTGFVNITGTNTDDVTVAVFDILGKQVINESLTNDRLNVSALNAGVYILKISQNNASVTKKLVIK